MNCEKMIGDLTLSFYDFYKDNEKILNRKVCACERALVFRLGLILQQKFDGYFVDCEFNKNGEKPKSLKNKRINFPDLIVHKRNNNLEDNLLIVEVKTPKYVNKVSMDNDIAKLKGFTSKGDSFQYQYGAHILLSKSYCILVLYTPNENKNFQIEYYEINGKQLVKCSKFRNRFIELGGY